MKHRRQHLVPVFGTYDDALFEDDLRYLHRCLSGEINWYYNQVPKAADQAEQSFWSMEAQIKSDAISHKRITTRVLRRLYHHTYIYKYTWLLGKLKVQWEPQIAGIVQQTFKRWDTESVPRITFERTEDEYWGNDVSPTREPYVWHIKDRPEWHLYSNKSAQGRRQNKRIRKYREALEARKIREAPKPKRKEALLPPTNNPSNPFRR
jgi:hypothetical protein